MERVIDDDRVTVRALRRGLMSEPSRISALDGAGFSANVLSPLISSKHPNFRPVDCKIGPDGAVYVADWYNSIINHAQHDFRDPRRDHERGRIWRITHKDRPLVKKPELVGRSIPHLVGKTERPTPPPITASAGPPAALGRDVSRCVRLRNHRHSADYSRPL